MTTEQTYQDNAEAAAFSEAVAQQLKDDFPQTPGALIATIDRIQQEWWEGTLSINVALSEIRSVLGGYHQFSLAKDQHDFAFDPSLPHQYLSTACRHNLHLECRQQCKFCPANCLCPHHNSPKAS